MQMTFFRIKPAVTATPPEKRDSRDDVEVNVYGNPHLRQR